jgi:hypothetical protein
MSPTPRSSIASDSGRLNSLSSVAGEQAGPGDAAWEALRDDALEVLDQLLYEATEAHEDLQVFSSAVVVYRKHLVAGGHAVDMSTMIDIASTRGSLTDRMRELERARHRARLALWKLQIAEGSSIAEVARVWGLSRQLVSRAIATDTPTTEPAPDQ